VNFLIKLYFSKIHTDYIASVLECKMFFNFVFDLNILFHFNYIWIRKLMYCVI